jgi:hypothetical protein
MHQHFFMKFDVRHGGWRRVLVLFQVNRVIVES